VEAVAEVLAEADFQVAALVVAAAAVGRC